MITVSDRDVPERLILIQELANTIDVERGQDALRSGADVNTFATRHGLEELELTAQDAVALRQLREALRAVCLAHATTDMPPEVLDALSHQLSAAPLVLTVDRTGDAMLRPSDGLSGVPAFTARIAMGVAAAQEDGSWQRLKACQASDCRRVYYDHSPTGRSRWCSMAVCGSRAKMRAYRARRRAR